MLRVEGSEFHLQRGVMKLAVISNFTLQSNRDQTWTPRFLFIYDNQFISSHHTGMNNGRYKTISSSNLVHNNNSPSVVSHRMKSCPSPQQPSPQQQQQVYKTQTRERGTSTTDDEIIQNDNSIDQVLHTPLQKTFTM